MIKVGTKSVAYGRMSSTWSLINDLLGGTQTMRDAANTWLPKHPRESQKKYESRLNKSILYEAYKSSVEFVAAKPFERVVQVKGELSERLKLIESDADYCGNSLTSVAYRALTQGVGYGLTFLLVDYPSVPTNLTEGEELKQRVHPYINVIHPENLWNHEMGKDEYGRRILLEVHFLEADDQLAAYKNDGTWTRYQLKDGDWVQTSTGTRTVKQITMRVFFTKRVGEMEAEPPLRGLAWLNLAHWQSDSDQRNILSFSRMPLLFQVGMTSEELEKPIEIGPTSVLRSTNKDAKMGYVEHTGAAIKCGADDIKSLEEKMESLALEPFVRRPGATATAVVKDGKKSESLVETWIRDLEFTIAECYRDAALWVNEKLPDDFAIDIFSDFDLYFGKQDDIKVLQEDRARGDLSLKTYLREVKRRGILSESVDIDVEVEEIDSEVPEPVSDEL